MPNNSQIHTAQNHACILRVLDANFNRLREGLRVVEEHFRFVVAGKDEAAGRLKLIRHSLDGMERAVGRHELLEARDTGTDPFAGDSRPEEFRRDGLGDVLTANMKRAQEAARVIEEYAKLGQYASVSEKAKVIRFELYTCEKELVERAMNGNEEEKR